MSGTPDHAIRSDPAHGRIAARRGPLGRLLVPLLAVSLAAVGAGCGSTVQEDSRLTVYVSLAGAGQDGVPAEPILAGAEQALADAGGVAGGARVALEPLDHTEGEARSAQWSQAGVAANARKAAEDSTSIAYIGELDAAATRVSAPITNEAGILQVAPLRLPREMLAVPGGNDVPTDIQTTGDRTLGSLMPPEGSLTVSPASPDAIGVPPSPLYGYGYESMAVILDSIERASDPLSRADVVAAYLATADRQSEVGTYSIAPDGAAAYSDDAG